MEKKKTEKEKKKFQPAYTPVKTTQLPNAPNPLNRSLHDHPPSPPRRMSSRTQRWLNRAPLPPPFLNGEKESSLASPRLGSPRLGSARAKLGHSLKRCRTRACTLRGVVVVVVGRRRRREIGGKKISDFHYGRARGGGCISRGADDFTGGRVRIFLPFGSRAECISGWPMVHAPITTNNNSSCVTFRTALTRCITVFHELRLELTFSILRTCRPDRRSIRGGIEPRKSTLSPFVTRPNNNNSPFPYIASFESNLLLFLNKFGKILGWRGKKNAGNIRCVCVCTIRSTRSHRFCERWFVKPFESPAISRFPAISCIERVGHRDSAFLGKPRNAVRGMF